MRLSLYGGHHMRMKKPNKRIEPMTSSAVCRWFHFYAGAALLVTAHPVRENLWVYLPMGAVFLFASVLFVWLRPPSSGARRRGLLFGLGAVALFATLVFAAFAYSLLRLLASGAASFDIVWSCSAVAAGALAAWLWSRFIRILRQT